ncbi:MAG TPA: DUF393 domain-containing protein, partial [Verrucomicrobiae bacterium]|nr:DUF393 domain-containing protein [Verrucomicrobiae bacterium]
MNTENTDKKKFAGWVLYDAECAFCSRLADWWAPRLAGRFRLLPLQAVAIRSRFGLTEAEWFGEMRLLTREGGHYGGADALVEIARRLWWARPLGLLARIPPTMQLLRAAYRWGARRRRCGNAACETRPEAATGRIR